MIYYIIYMMKNILITGGSSGIGKTYLDMQGKDINFHIITRNRSLADSSNLSYYMCDLSSAEDIDELISSIKDKGMTINGFIHCAGITLPQNDEVSFETWEETLKINFFSASKLIGGIKDIFSSNSSIVFVSSIGAVLGFEDNPSYQISKAALKQFTKSLAVDLAPDTRVNCILPGYIKTEMTSKSFRDSDKRKKISEKTLLDRWGEPSEVAKVINFLISDESSYINGQSILVDGGWTAKGI